VDAPGPRPDCQGGKTKPLAYRREIEWVRDRWLISHFYGVDAMGLTVPEFLDALANISKVQAELRPKTLEEITAMMAVSQAAKFKQARKAKEAAQMCLW